MKKATNKILSFLTAFAMVIGVLVAPFASANAAAIDKNSGTFKAEDISDEKPDSTNLVIHKIGTDGESINGPFDHNGGVLSPEQLKAIGTNPIELNNVEFSIYEVTAAQLQTFLGAPDSYKTKDQVEAVVKKEPVQTVTTKEGKGATAQLTDGNYWAIESDKPESVTDSLAVPFGITLPLMNTVPVKVGEKTHAAGTVYLKNVHIYPKNLTNKPTTDKNFDKKAENAVTEDELVSEVKDLEVKHDGTEGREKSTATKNLGSTIPYLVETVFPGSTQYKSAYWDDRVTEGLTLNDDVNLTFQTQVNGEWTNVENTAGYWTKTTSAADTDGKYFRVSLTEAGLQYVNNQKNPVRVQVRYTGKVNGTAKVGREEANDVTFFYGNNPSKGNTPIPQKPENSTIEATKTWAEGPMPAGASVELALFDAHTGKQVQDTKTINADNQKATWSGLDDSRQYKVVEIKPFAGYEAEYILGEANGKLTVKNHKTNNPTPIKPSEPRVVFGGKRFVKTDESEDENRLAGAEFVIRNKETGAASYLVYSNTDQKAVNNAKDALYAAIENYNGLAKEQQTAELRNEIDALQKAFNNEFKKAAQTLEWSKATGDEIPANAVRLVSDAQGRFDISGLSYGEDYYLQEVRAPQGYAVNDKRVNFVVNKESYYQEGDIKYEQTETPETAENNRALKVVNRNLTIPQTGGIGSLIFYVVGAAIVVGAIVAMKRRNSVEA